MNALRFTTLRAPKAICISRWLTDWTDAANEQTDGDTPLIAAAAEGVARLNLRYGPAPGGTRFLLLHRRRVWNEGESRWIGWERKRGKLHELNWLLRGATDTTFMDVGFGTPAAPTGIRYVVTLDFRHPIAARCGASPDRQDGASAEPAAPRCRWAPGYRGLRGLAASRYAVAADRPRRLGVPKNSSRA